MILTNYKMRMYEIHDRDGVDKHGYTEPSSDYYSAAAAAAAEKNGIVNILERPSMRFGITNGVWHSNL